jgi:hypothetical protein
MKVALTFDTDWAPDYVLEHVFEILQSFDLPATFFFTNQTDADVPESVEVGLHPDFRAASPQGRGTEEILDNMLDWFPNAIGVRNHRWYWDYGLYELLPECGVKYDSSLLLPLTPGLAPNVAYGSLARFPVWWTDNLHLDRCFPLNAVRIPGFEEDGLKVMIFHPINIYLNMTRGVFEQDVSRFEPRSDSPRRELDAMRNPGEGLQLFFNTLCQWLKEGDVDTVTLGECLP